MNRRTLLPIAALAAAFLTAPLGAQGESPDTNPVLRKLAGLVGGTWKATVNGPQGPAAVEFRWERAFSGQGLRARGVIGKGAPNAVETESFFGWDPHNKHVYYIDFHGAGTVFKGVATLKGDAVETEFAPIVGHPATYVSVDEFPDPDTLASRIYSVKDGKRSLLVEVRMKRER